ncbi:unnamed protein product [Phytophthora fragariaefolia]|uniref:Unnamed protein product n=1 Tax=Phytophthora fragariaefolia TaxID=1490495 RepID=A0A9W6X7X3_9STRA|nr:unnamed protein product [Phytophthora fragariaefolia]
MAKAKVSNEELKRKIKRPKARHEAAEDSPVAPAAPAASRSLASAVAPPKLQSPSPNSRGTCRYSALHSDAMSKAGEKGTSSLGLLTKRFVELIQAAPSKDLDLNTAAESLGVQSISDLRQEEQKYDQYIKMVSQNIRHLYEEEAFDKGSFENFCYVTHDDMRQQESFADQSVMAIKAPPGTTLEVPDPDEGMSAGKRRFQIFLKSTVRRMIEEVEDVNGSAKEAGAIAAPDSPAPPLDQVRQELYRNLKVPEPSANVLCAHFAPSVAEVVRLGQRDLQTRTIKGNNTQMFHSAT